MIDLINKVLVNKHNKYRWRSEGYTMPVRLLDRVNKDVWIDKDWRSGKP